MFSSGHIVCRPTQKEAEDYYEYYAVENADLASVETLMKTLGLRYVRPRARQR